MPEQVRSKKLFLTNNLLFFLPKCNCIGNCAEMIVVVVVAGVRHIAAKFGNHSIAGIHVKTGFGSAFEVNGSSDIYRQT